MYYSTPKLLYIELTNFARLYAGMGLTHVEIDFTQFDNRLFILVGNNGTGKTSLMSCFHPFAYNNGSAANSDLILENKDGSKIVQYGYLNHIYYIEHIYTRKKDGSLSVKSYIKEDEKELNETGLVSTFKEIVEKKLGVHENFLTLLLLADSIKGFVDYTSGERKKYAASIFQRLQIFAKYNKNASAYVRDLKVIMNENGRKLELFRGTDEDSLQQEYVSWSKEVERIDKELAGLQNEFGGLNERISASQSIISDYDSKVQRLTDLLSDIDRIKRKIQTIDDEVVLQNLIKSKQEELTKVQVRISSLDATIKGDIDMQDMKTQSLKESQETLNRMKNHLDFEELTEYKASLERQIAQLDLNGIERPKYKQTDLIKAQVYLEELKGLSVDLITNLNNPEVVVPEVLDKITKDPKIIDKLGYHYEALKEQYNTISATNKNRSLLDVFSSLAEKEPDCNTADCFYRQFYHSVMTALTSSESETDKLLERKKSELSLAEDMAKASRIIKKLYKYLYDADILKTIPITIFNPKTFISEFMETREIYNRDALSTLIDLVERFETYDKLSDDLKTVNQRLSMVGDTKEMYMSLEYKIGELTKEIKVIDSRLTTERENFSFNKSEESRLTKEIDDLQNQLIAVIELSTARLEVNVVKEEIAKMDGQMNDIKLNQAKMEQLNDQILRLRRQQADARNSADDAKHRHDTLVELMDARADLLTKYKEAEMIQEATSPTKGIPVAFLSDYVKGPLLHEVNRLLNPVYHGRMRILIEDTVIDDKEFTIPYMIGDTIVYDISSASDGQRAILSLAFSLAFSKLIKKTNNWFYCIFLLDEKDAKLDMHSRAEFVSMITNFMDDIGADQLFLISHNAMFDGYPVNVLMTSDSNISNMPDAQVLRVYEKR